MKEGKKMEITNNLLAALIIVAMAISIAGTMTMLSVVPGQAPVITGMAQGQETGQALAEVAAEASIILLVDTVDFGSISPAGTDDTVDKNPHPFVLNNNGSVDVNVSVGINGNNLWDTAWNDGNFTFNGSDNQSGTTYQWIQDSWANLLNGSGPVPTSILVYNLSSDADKDSINVELKIIVPPSEASGSKSCNVRFNASVG
jgi:hypothetical protein